MSPQAASETYLPFPLSRQAAERPEGIAVEVSGTACTYAELHAVVASLASSLRALGVSSGDRVAVLLPDDLRMVMALHAVAGLGAVLVPLNRRLTADELTWQLEWIQPKLLITHAGSPLSLHASTSTPIPHSLRRVVLQAEGDRASYLVRNDGTSTRVSIADGLSLLGEGADPLLPRLDLASPQCILFTSGTSGRPKGAVLTVGNLLWSALGSALRLGIAPGDRWLAPMPLFHVGGLSVLWRSALAGGTALLPNAPFDARAIAQSLSQDQVHRISLVPTMLQRLLEAWGDHPAPPHLRTVLLGGGPIPPDLLARARSLGFPIAPTYGLTEAASQVATAAPATGDHATTDRAPSGAPPLPFTELRIIDDEGRVLPPSVTGQIILRGPTVMAGYWRDEESTRSTLSDGWLHTGDLGWLDDLGHLHVGGRREDLIVSGGENIYPAEIEAVLLRHPAIADCCVLPDPDPHWGQRPLAVLVPTASPPPQIQAPTATHPLPPDLDAFLRHHLASYKLPHRYLLSPPLPRTPSGKLQRAALRHSLPTPPDQPPA